MFSGCLVFNQPINFNTSSATSFLGMFYNCRLFNQTINFIGTNVTTMTQMFRNCYVLNSPITISNTSSVANMSLMFYAALLFDQDISGLDITSLTNATSMLFQTSFSQTNYDLLLPAWDAYGTSGVTFHAGSAQYTAAPSAPATAHANLTGRGWVITDGGPI